MIFLFFEVYSQSFALSVNIHLRTLPSMAGMILRWKMSENQKRYAFAGIIIEDRVVAPEVQKILSEYSSLISGRMGIPNLEDGKLSIITIILHATTDEIGALSGKIGRLDGVSIKTGISKV